MLRSSLRKALVIAATGALVAVGLPVTALAASADNVIYTHLNGAHEVPGPGDPNGHGDFSAVLTKTGMCYAFSVGQMGKPMMAHIHVGAPDVAGPVIVTLQLPTKAGITECLTAVPDADDTAVTLGVSELAALKHIPSSYYVNVHSDAYPSGAIRGQLAK